MTKCVIL